VSSGIPVISRLTLIININGNFMPDSSPNFLILMVDQMSGALFDQDMIAHLHIPNMRALIDKGVTFEKAYCSSPLCTPARGSFMNGMLPSRSGIYDNAAEFTASTPTYAHYLRNMGYQTALSGKMHFVGPDQLHGFEERLTTDIYPADFGWTPDWRAPLTRIDWWYHNLSSVTQAGVAEISNQLEFDDEAAYCAKLQLYKYARRVDSRPFCLTVSFTHPHDPYIARGKYWDLYDHASIPMPIVDHIPYDRQDPHSKRLYEVVDHHRFQINDDDIRNARHAYFANISYLDEKMGEILQVLENCDFADNTVILLCADHGDMLGERGLWYKMCFYEYSMRIPFVLHAPALFNPHRNTTPVATQDILPTLLELASKEQHHLACEIDGSSLAAFARGKQQPERSVLGEYCAEGSISPMIMIRCGDYKFVYCEADPAQLFDIKNDPNELINLANLADNQPLVDSFIKQMNDRWQLPILDAEVRHSQACRQLISVANREGKFSPWDYQPRINASERYMRNHLDLNDLENNNRYPKS
jgi:choline-sulfatase